MAEAKQNPTLHDHNDLLLMLQKLSCNNVDNNNATRGFTTTSSSTNLIPSSPSFGPRAYQDSQFQYVPEHGTGLNNGTRGFTTTTAPTNLIPSSSFGSGAYQDSQFQYVPDHATGLNYGTRTAPTNLIPSSSFGFGAYQDSQFQYVPEHAYGKNNLIPSSLSSFGPRAYQEYATGLYNNVGHQDTRSANLFSPMNSTYVNGGDQLNSFVDNPYVYLNPMLRSPLSTDVANYHNDMANATMGGNYFADYDNAMANATMGGNYVSPSSYSTVQRNGGNSYCKKNTTKRFNGDEEILKNYLRDSKHWTDEEILKLHQSDPSLLNKLEGKDIVFMARDQLGSSYLQRIISTGNLATVTRILDAVIDGLFSLIVDPCGNRVFYKLLMKSRFYEELMQIIVSGITMNSGQLVIAGCNNFGSRSIQNLLKTLKSSNSPLINNVMLALRPGIKGLMLNNEGRHVIKYCVNFLSYDQCESIFMVAKQECLDLARDDIGYLSLLHCIETIRDPLRKELLIEITKYSVHLSQEPNGNYVLQKVLGLENPFINEIICNKMKDHVFELSTQKHSSYVIELCLGSTSMEIVFLEILKWNPKQMSLVAQDQFGNYVVQKALQVSKVNRKDLYQSLVKLLIRENLRLVVSLQNHPNGKNIYSLLQNSMSSSKWQKRV